MKKWGIMSRTNATPTPHGSWRSYPWLPTPRDNCIGLVRNYSDRSTLGHDESYASYYVDKNVKTEMKFLDPSLELMVCTPHYNTPENKAQGERDGVASQPTIVFFRANKIRWITEIVDGASY
uniref:(California timema) hypothetical protein n=1 Tax=Timema californicum TaxID=61474 RepID=A0A7R9PBI0_TIMCA|nr:unnamed protein product [Timema californicum]